MGGERTGGSEGEERRVPKSAPCKKNPRSATALSVMYNRMIYWIKPNMIMFLCIHC